MNYLLILIYSVSPVKDVPTESVKEILAWVVGLLVLAIIALFTYFTKKENSLKKELIGERTYSREQDNKNIKTLVNVNNILEQVVKQSDKTHENIGIIKPLINENAKRLEQINAHILNN